MFGYNRYSYTQPDPISGSEVISGPGCAGQCNGSIEVTPDGGSGNLAIINWVGTNDDDLLVEDLCPGIYTLQLTDSNGNILKTKGIKLNTIPPLPLFEAEDESPMTDQPSLFETKVAEPEGSYASNPPRNQITEPEQIWEQRWLAIENRLDILEASNSPKKAAIELSKLQEENSKLKNQNAELSQQLQEAQNKLEQFRQLLLGEANSAPTPVQKKEVPTAPTINKEAPKVHNIVSETKPKTQAAAKKGRKPGKAVERAKRIFLQVQEWNHSNPDSTFVINPGFLETLFRINRKAARSFCTSPTSRQHFTGKISEAIF